MPTLEPASPAWETFARDTLPLHISPDEHAARESHNYGLFDFDRYSYSDPTLHAWIHRLGAILRGAEGMPNVATLRTQYLNPAELELIEREIQRQDLEGL